MRSELLSTFSEGYLSSSWIGGGDAGWLSHDRRPLRVTGFAAVIAPKVHLGAIAEDRVTVIAPRSSVGTIAVRHQV
jgi:hypothetical protein